jgi:hypothetical protein
MNICLTVLLHILQAYVRVVTFKKFRNVLFHKFFESILTMSGRHDFRCEAVLRVKNLCVLAVTFVTVRVYLLIVLLL